jgi:hypothetical protein
MANITRQQFNQALSGKSIDINQAQQDSRLSRVNMRRADLDGDGKIAGDQEIDKLYLEVDRFDNNGSYGSMRLHNSDGSQTTPGQQVEALGQHLNVASLQSLAKADPRNDDILLVGMNKTASHEASRLRARGNNVTFVKDAAQDDTIRVGGRTYDLQKDADIDGFVGTLGLSAEQSAKVKTAIKSTGADGRDELAQIAQVWAKAEAGGQVPSRLVLSGHSVGDGVWGDDNGDLTKTNISLLADAMPKAARQVEDLHIAGCYSGGKSDMEDWKGIFPNAKTIWAYTGSAPGSYSGATAHQARWDRATRGDADDLDRGVIAGRGIRKGDNVAVWSEKSGYDDGSTPSPIANVRSAVTRGDATFQAYFSGDRTVQNTQYGPLRDHYNNIQALRQHPDLPRPEQADVRLKRDQTIRLLYFDKHVKGHFANHHAGKIQAAYQALGKPAPDFSQLSRKQTLAVIGQFESDVSALGAGAPQAAKDLLPLLTDGLRDLKPSVIPDTWI